MKTTYRAHALPALACLLVALAGCCNHKSAGGHPPHAGGTPVKGERSTQRPGMLLMGRVFYNQQWLSISKNETLLLRAVGAEPKDGREKQAFDVLAGAYPQNSGSGTLTVLNDDVAARLDGEVYAYAKGVRPITVTKRIRTYSPGSELAVWCRDNARKDYVFACEKSARVTLTNPRDTTESTMFLQQGYCVRVYSDEYTSKTYFADPTPLKISDLGSSGNPELKSMSKFYEDVYGFASGAGLNPTSATAPPHEKPPVNQPDVQPTTD